jgi:D-alanyl-D-alanine carboxypeptidase
VRINFARLSLCTANIKKQVKIVNVIKLLHFYYLAPIIFSAEKLSQHASFLGYSLVLRKVSNSGVNKKWLCQSTKMDNAVAKTTRFLPLAAFLVCATFLFYPQHADARAKTHHHVHSGTHMKPRTQAENPKYAMIIMDAQSGRIIDQQNPHKVLPPASLTKIMTLFMTFEALERHQINLDDYLTISPNAIRQSPSKLGMRTDEKITYRQAIYVVVTRSANDVAMALAENIGGSSQKFTQMMTARAHSLGMHESTFVNPSGLPNPGQKSSAYDMAILARATMQYFPQYYHIFNTIRYNYKGQTIETHNNLMRRFKGMDGLKTGYTVASGFNLVASAVRDNRRVIVVVFGGASAVSRDNHVADLMDRGLDMLSKGETKTQFASATPVTVTTKMDVKTVKTVITPSPQAVTQTPTVTEKVSAVKITTTTSPGTPVVSDTTHVTSNIVRPVVTPTASVTQPSKPDDGTVKPLVAPSTTVPVAATFVGKWGIQVGAYNSQKLSQQRVETVLSKISPIVGQASITPSKSKHSTIYRARIVGLSQQNAAKACRILKQQCMAFATR